ncbi:MAG: rubredoxin [Dehalobacterium sp.]
MSTQKQKQWQCQMPNCGYIYDPGRGCKKNKIEKGCSFEDLPENYRCPLCGASKKQFKECNWD